MELWRSILYIQIHKKITINPIVFRLKNHYFINISGLYYIVDHLNGN